MPIDAARAKSLFLIASDVADPSERADYLECECGGDSELRARVEALLRANAAAPLPAPGGAVVTPASGPVETKYFSDRIARVGVILAGKYKLVEEIGAGGMGSVFMAQQTEPVKRAVAVKVIKAGMDSRAVLARFEAERQALAMMDHPNIAKVLDAGTTDGGRSFFVMELVKGTPITRYCDEHKLTRASVSSCSCRCARRFSTPTKRESSIATSSPRTCWWRCTTTNPCRRSSTLAWPRPRVNR